LDTYAKEICSAKNRVEDGLKEAVRFINTAKKYHDELETCYVPAMDFDGMTVYREKLVEELNTSVFNKE
jgi:hypothetical protein